MGCFCFVVFVHFYVLNVCKNREKCKKMQKNAKKSQKNLHVSKICCNFAPSFKNKDKRNPIRNPKIETKNEQDLHDKELRRNRS